MTKSNYRWLKERERGSVATYRTEKRDFKAGKNPRIAQWNDGIIFGKDADKACKHAKALLEGDKKCRSKQTYWWMELCNHISGEHLACMRKHPRRGGGGNRKHKKKSTIKGNRSNKSNRSKKNKKTKKQKKIEKAKHPFQSSFFVFLCL